MNNTFDPSLLSGYLDGELQPEEKALVERVLDEQPERRRQLDDLKRLQQSLATLPAPQPTRDPVESVRQRVDQQQSGVALPLRRSWLHLTSLALAASLLLAVGWAIFGSNRDAPQVASEGAPEAGSEQAAEHQTMLAPQEPDDEEPASDEPASELAVSDPAIPERAGSEPAARNESAESFPMLRESQEPRPRADRLYSQRHRDERSADREERIGEATDQASGEADQALMLRAPTQAFDQPRSRERSRAVSPPGSDLPQRAEPAAPMQLRRTLEEPSAAMGISAAGSPGEPQRADLRDALLLRYVIPVSEQAETVRWLHEIAPQDLVALPSAGFSVEGDEPRGEALNVPKAESPAADFADGAEDSTAEIIRYWFRGNPAEQRALRLAMENRAQATEAELKIVRPGEAAPQSSDMEGSEAAVKKKGDEPLSQPDATQPDQQPSGILIELIVRPTP